MQFNFSWSESRKFSAWRLGFEFNGHPGPTPVTDKEGDTCVYRYHIHLGAFLIWIGGSVDIFFSELSEEEVDELRRRHISNLVEQARRSREAITAEMTPALRTKVIEELTKFTEQLKDNETQPADQPATKQ